MTLIDDSIMERRCRAIVDSLDLPSPCTVATLVASIAEQQQRDIVLRPLPDELIGEVSGMVRHTDDGYEIFYPCEASSWWAMACVGHEVGHIVCGHVPDPRQPATPSQVELDEPGHGIEDALPLMSDAMAAWGGLYRCRSQGPREREAEFVASLLLQRAHRPAPRSVISAVLAPPSTYGATASGRRRPHRIPWLWQGPRA